MGHYQRAGHMDVSNTVDVSDPVAVAAAVRQILEPNYSAIDGALLDTLFLDFSRLYAGSFPGFRACDVPYHNAQHVLDVTLAMARLLDGQCGSERIDATQALAGIAAALFHDSGYIRRKRDTRSGNGAVYTLSHVSRGARFLAEYLPAIGLESMVETCGRLVHFTGYEVAPCDLAVANAQEYHLGSLLGTADLIAQMADVDYVRKCREDLYAEFVAGGIAGDPGIRSPSLVRYRSSEELLQLTPQFMRTAITERLDGQFNRVHRYATEHFGGRDLYMDAIAQNCSTLEQMLARGES